MGKIIVLLLAALALSACGGPDRQLPERCFGAEVQEQQPDGAWATVEDCSQTGGDCFDSAGTVRCEHPAH